MSTIQKNNLPLDGLAGLKQNFTSDSLSGFIVFLLALPLSLGIAKASEFPPLMGLVTAIIGGMLVSLLAGSKLTIKGPAAGLIVILVGAVADFGGGVTGWHYTLGAIVVAGIIQILFGIFKLGKLVDIFPLSAVHGMLAAIGLIIILKQFPVLLDVDPALTKGKTPFQLIASIPTFISHYDWKATLIGVVSFLIMMFWNKIPNAFIRKIPAALVVLIIAIPAELAMNFQTTEPTYALVHIGNLLDNIKLNVSFDGIHQTGTFIKYVVMFALVGSLESLLTVKAIDIMDPLKQKSNTNRDIIAVGVGNIVAGVLGGLPMISEVARSSANVNNGAKTRWANFFHGLFILVFVLFASHLIELIPNCALAAMLISVGIKLAHPKEFIHVFQIGKEQLAIFLVTIFFTLFEDLLVGIAAGMLLKIVFHLINGAPLSSLFKAPASVSFDDDKHYVVEIEKAAIFTNFLGIKSKLEAIPAQMNVTIDLTNTKLIDHSVMENIHQFQYDYTEHGGQVNIIGIEEHKPFSNHQLAGRKKTNLKIPAILILIGLSQYNAIAQTPSLHLQTQNNNAWFMYFGDHKFSKNMGIHLEAQLRRADLGKNPQQLLLRTGLNYHFLPQVTGTIGYCFVETYPYGDFPVKSAFPEHRIWEQIQLKHQLNQIEWINRLRLEQRFSKLPILEGNSYEPGDAMYTNRARILNRASIPFKGKSIQDKSIYISAYDELLINFGKNVAANLFDQNRAYIALGYKIPHIGRLETGYLYQAIQKSDGVKIENNHTFQLGLSSTIDFYKPSKAL
jgi:MFS superfamily sulfate permease-like transporter